MARYDRRMLVPYLQDLCALASAEMKLKGSLAAANFRLLCGAVLRILSGLGILGLVWYVQDWVRSYNEYLEWLYGASGPEYWKMNMDEVMEYVLPSAFSLIFIVAVLIVGFLLKKNKAAVSEIQNELDRVVELMNFAYDANVIPIQYRTTRSVFYLYNWFGSSGSDDLDMAINTLVHEDGEKLDSLVVRQYRQILQQRVELAKQHCSGARPADAGSAPLSYGRMAQTREAVNVFFAIARYL